MYGARQIVQSTPNRICQLQAWAVGYAEANAGADGRLLTSRCSCLRCCLSSGLTLASMPNRGILSPRRLMRRKRCQNCRFGLKASKRDNEMPGRTLS
eukprot:2229428-Pleurochrysis_carterae.AAC.2